MKKTILMTLATIVLLGGGTLVYKDVKADVESSVTGSREQKHALMREGQEESLNEAVGAGIITQDQADTIQAKREEMRMEHTQAREEHRAEMQEWAEENGIDLEKIREHMGSFGPKEGFGRRSGDCGM